LPIIADDTRPQLFKNILKKDSPKETVSSDNQLPVLIVKKATRLKKPITSIPVFRTAIYQEKDYEKMIATVANLRTISTDQSS
jgi:hypothetical protein